MFPKFWTDSHEIKGMGSHLNLERFVHEYPQNWGFAFSFHFHPTRIIETTEDIVLWARRVTSTYENCNDLRITLEITERVKILNYVARSRELRFQKRLTMRLQLAVACSAKGYRSCMVL